MLSRRHFLQSSSIVSLSPLLPAVFQNTAHAATAAADSKILVVIQLDGGNDGINTVVPLNDDGYGRARKKLRLDAEKLHKLDEHVGLHPNMQAAKELFDDGRLTIVQGVGYPNPNRSHFSSMKIWQTAPIGDAFGDVESFNDYGWLGRALDRSPAKPASGGADAIFVGEQETPVALWGRRSSATALSRADDLRFNGRRVTAAPSLASSPNDQSLRQFVTKQLLAAYAAADEFERQELAAAGDVGSNYPDTQLATRLRLVAKLLKSGAHARVYYAVQGGYDTHAAQVYAHARLLREFSGALKASLDDLKAAKLDDRVVVLAFSEFGRRVEENDSQGTDHGTAGPVFLAGSPVAGGLIGNAPDLSNLDGGDVKMQTDFRSVYATILDEWLEVDSRQVLGQPFDQLPLFNL